MKKNDQERPVTPLSPGSGSAIGIRSGSSSSVCEIKYLGRGSLGMV